MAQAAPPRPPPPPPAATPPRPSAAPPPPPAGAGGGAGTTHIGVPDGYTIEQPFKLTDPRSRLPRLPLYESGAELDPFKWSPEIVANLQRELMSVGLITPGTTISAGYADESTILAYRDALAFANRRGVKYGEAIETLRSLPRGKAGDVFGGLTPSEPPTVTGGNIGGGATDVIRLSDPASLRARADKIGQAILGRKPSADQRDRVVAELQAEEADPQRQVNAAQEAQRRTMFDTGNAAEVDRAIATLPPAPGSATPPGTAQPEPAAPGRGVSVGGFGRVERPATAQPGDVAHPGDVPIDANLRAFIAAAPGKITIGDKVRTRAQQEALKRKKPNLAAAPGSSKHETGEAADLVFEGGHDGVVARWAHANAARFGLSFPMLSKAKGKKYEPWHVELPGKRGSHGAGSVPSGTGEPATPVPIIGLPNTYVPATSTTVTDVDPDARLAERIRSSAPGEAGAHDLADVYGRTMRILGIGA